MNFHAAALLEVMIVNTASMRAEDNWKEAIKFRAMAEAETDRKLHRQLIELAEQYEQLADSPAPNPPPGS